MHLNRISYTLLCVFGLIFFNSCSKKKEYLPETDFKPKSYPIGYAADVLEKTTIGPEGGSLSSIDGELELIVPAGALSAPTEVSIEPITNTNPGGVGYGFRLKPHGITFNKEVELKFHYGNDTHPVSADFLGVAYQDENQYWCYLPSSEVDVVNKVVKVKTKHFSDWTLMQWMYLLPPETVVKTSKNVHLRAVRVLPAATDVNDYITPLVPPGDTKVMVGEQVDLETKYIKKWSVSRNIGKLAVEGNKATYTAPNSLPDVNPVAISVSLNAGNHQVLLISNIEILEGDIQFTIGGANPVVLEGFLLRNSNGENILSSTSNGGRFALKWKGSGNNFSFNITDHTFQYIVPASTSLYSSTYNMLGQPIEISAGGIQINSENAETISGTFKVIPAGHFALPTGNRIEVAPIAGKFNVRKVGL